MIYFIGGLIFTVIVLVLYGFLSNYILTVNNYCIESDELYKCVGDKKIVLLSDLHNVQFGKNNTKLIKKIDDIKPKIIIIAGDIVNHHDSKNNPNAKEFITELSSRYKVIYSDGNHEQGFFDNEDGSYNTDKFNEFYKDANVEHLVNTSIKINNVIISGVMIKRSYYRRIRRPEFTKDYLSNTLGKCDKNCYNVLIAHNPMYFEDYVRWGADLVLSGHVHGGFVRIPGIGGVISPQFKIFPKYSGGLYRYNKGTMILSRGLGSHTIKFRVFNSPEIVVLTIKRSLEDR